MTSTTVKPSPPGPLRFARVAFTGRLAAMTRREATGIAADAGAHVATGVSRRTSMLVVGMDGWPLLPDGAVSAKLRRAEQLNRAGARIRIISEREFLEIAGLRRRTEQLRKSYTEQAIGELLGVDPETLRGWERLGLVQSADGRYDFQDIVSLRTIAQLVGDGVKAEVISRNVRGLASVLPGTERPLAQLTIVMEHSRTLLAEIGDLLIDPRGQMLLNFPRSGAGAFDDRPDTEPIPLHADTTQEPGADDWFEHAQALEEDERLEEARHAYERAIAARPHHPEAHFNLGNVLRAMGRNDAAEERFRMAIAQEPQLAEAWYNLADVQEQRGQLDEAVASLRQAIAASPAYADAHYNIAWCLDEMNRPEDAATHWRAYLQLDPDSEWAAQARRRLATS